MILDKQQSFFPRETLPLVVTTVLATLALVTVLMLIFKPVYDMRVEDSYHNKFMHSLHYGDPFTELLSEDNFSIYKDEKDYIIIVINPTEVE